MSVEADNIKKTANAADTMNKTEDVDILNHTKPEDKNKEPEILEETAANAEPILPKTENRPATRKAAGRKSVSQKTATPQAEKKQTTGKSTPSRTTKKVSDRPSTLEKRYPERKEAKASCENIIYEIGQELPSYLL